MTDEPLFTFSPEPTPGSAQESTSNWVVLSVEDDTGYQQSLKLGLSGLTVKDKPVKFITANSAAQASRILAETDDIAVILLDVVMERDNAGLFLINTIRTILGNARVRIILLTGQPGMAPRRDTFKEYDIDEYWSKVDLTEEKLRGVVAANIKTWSNLNELYIAKRGLQMIVDASRALTSKQDVNEFTYTVLNEVSRVIGIPETGGVVCAYRPTMGSLSQCEVVASTGDFSRSSAPMLSNLLKECSEEATPVLTSAIEIALKQQEHQFFQSWSVLYFSTADVDSNHYLIIVRSPQPLEQSHITLLMVYSENISNGFVNLALLNKLSMLAYFDEALEIPNRHWLQREITNLSAFDRSNTSLVMISLQDFSTSEITLGSEFSSKLLLGALSKIKQCCHKARVVCYLEDGLFGLLYKTDLVALESALKNLHAFSLPINGGEQPISNIISYVEIDDLDHDDLRKSLKAAQLVHFSGRPWEGTISAISRKMLDAMSDRHTLLKRLSDAIASPDAFFLEFQPKVNLKSKQTVGVEALLRWRLSDNEIVPPDVFIPLAEASGLITKLDSVVTDLSIAAAKSLSNHNYPFSVAFNVTQADLMLPTFIPRMKQLLRKHDVHPSLIELEITETQAMEDYEKINPLLNALLEMGINISIDDFGTGYSSLAHLSTLSATALKVDKRFIDSLENNDASSGNHILDMVHSLSNQCNFKLIAEGIETEKQRNILINKGYKVGQGYLFAKPMPLNNLLTWLDEQCA